MSGPEIAKRLLMLLSPDARVIAVSATARVVNQGMGVAIPAVAAALVVGFEPGDGIGGLLLLLLALTLVKGTARYVEQFTGHAVTFRLLAELRVETYRNIVPLVPGGLDDERSGDLVARVVADIDRVEPFYAHTIAPAISAVTVPVLAAVGLAVWVDPVLAAVFLPFPLLIVLFAPWLRFKRVAELSAAARELNGETTAIFTDTVQGAREIAVFEARDTALDWIQGQSASAASTRKALARISSLRAGIGDLLAGAAVVAVAAVAAGRLEAGVIDLAGLAAALAVAWVGTSPARALEDVVPHVEEALAAGARLFDLADREPPIPPPKGRFSQERGGSVSFRDLTVEFPHTHSPALAGVDAEISDNSYVAVVGPSGSGKSTLVELPVRLRDPSAGRVDVGGADVTTLDPSSLHAEVTLVPQRPDIFFGSIADNLLLAKPGATKEELWEALDRAALGPWARSLQNGLATTVGELGETLSGGERQRLAIARAFLRDPEVLILDETTSELDTAIERQVLGEVARERGRRTIVVVAHRLDTITDADEILVLDRGRLVERGRHEALVAAGGVYSALWQRHRDLIEETT
ncbi:MAG: amino acid ABC transporter ATP-binding/permease protein [Acidimicrobiia bacterium]